MIDPNDGDTRRRDHWVEIWAADVQRWSILCTVEEWHLWQIEGSDRCHNPVNRDAKTGPDTTAACLRALAEARDNLKGLPTNREQNYKAHRSIDAVAELVREIADGVCYAWEVRSGKASE